MIEPPVINSLGSGDSNRGEAVLCLGETLEEVEEVMHDLRAHDVACYLPQCESRSTSGGKVRTDDVLPVRRHRDGDGPPADRRE